MLLLLVQRQHWYIIVAAFKCRIFQLNIATANSCICFLLGVCGESFKAANLQEKTSSVFLKNSSKVFVKNSISGLFVVSAVQFALYLTGPSSMMLI